MRCVKTIPIILGLCLVLAVQAHADQPTFSPLKQTATGRSQASELVLMPQPADPSKPAGPLGRMVTRDMRTGEVTVREGVSAQEFLDHAIQPGGVGMSAGPDRNPVPGDKNFADWSKITYPAFDVNPQHVKVWMDFEGVGYVCSGTLIDPMHVITAGHCLYSHDPPFGWADKVQVAPGYQAGYSPWGLATAVQMHSWTGWTEDDDVSHDMGVIDLDRPIGVFTGWRGFGHNTDCDWFDYGYWKHYAYPAEMPADTTTYPPFDGEQMYANWGDFDNCFWELNNIVSWDGPSWGGASGCGAIREGVVYATHQGSNREDSSSDVWITPNKFAHIQGWLADDVPANPDLMPIFVQVEDMYFAAGDPLDPMSFVLASYSDQGVNAGVFCDIYLSEDNYISVDDVWIDDVNVSVDVPGMGSQLVGVSPPPTIPLATPAGSYFIGIIINYDDANALNNITAAVELDSISVDCNSPGETWITSPEEGVTCQPVNLTIDWFDLDDIDFYQLRIDTWCGGGNDDRINTGPASQHTLTDLANDTTYYVQVRGRRHCGSWGDWSDCGSFTTLDIPTSDVNFLTPSENDPCMNPAVVSIAWSPVPGATGYELRVGEDCNSGNTYSLPSSTPYMDVTDLQADTIYRYLVRVKGVCDNWGDWSDCRTFCTLPVSGVPGPDDVVTRFILAGNYPNPLNPSTTIRFAVPGPAHVRLGVFDLQGRRVCTLHNGPVDGPGWHEVQWRGTDDAGQRVAAGGYFYRLEAGDYVETKRMTLVK